MDDMNQVPYWNTYKIQSTDRTVAWDLCSPDLRAQILRTTRSDNH